ncbi:peptidylprolyl isomerase [Helicobacter sp. 12S02634-8]|uniref:peptidylprolyl isomerase n=1 Tax=Helicobacter sp. 12S02634-8 TaxID=1476199 RepID=UPI000BA5B548|nr:peptidylprolyl isomerase [Helicobacter sp. 12S02634-8]PAF48509.1 peptidylprolyl isomerase [Helicobacter sp. 12S02634-8]
MPELKVYTIDPAALQKLQYALIKTNKGEMCIKLFPDNAPQTVTNFASLAQAHFYDGLKFHRVIQGFVAQGGCPEGSGRGGPGYQIQCELEGNPNKHKKGALSMAHAGRNTGGSQFFLCFVPLPHLDGEHTVFGQIDPTDQASLAVLDTLKQDDTIESISITESKPKA